ncbi:hypothetical protein Ngar_c03660 [Candidatus Nitrososphaera gargensis Ga9.2]|uniref:Uncharacterized protein n=1 Tax=Nitrososphaera gargensis (strain Ga9.2) TaxID=1237085 RepID=K0ILT3_NITGG|nr:hypothetical protein [Candidatus Nitrososphaera gargensis]AFU57283.1 hypothetical protein Ngar_c03350 [Candidatus Nitrososphaera gargensis Ga9.2]AFU57314.1 hypothetical protein Ngar_c03660 [Candidatus Nitrososphaera gargensis Ga9.2]
MAIIYHKANQQLPQDLSALGNLKVAIQENSAATTSQDVNVKSVSGVAQTARDWSSDLSNLPLIKAKTDNLDTALSTRATEATLSGVKTQTDKLSFDVGNALKIQNPPNLDTALSTRASETTLASVNTKIGNIEADADALTNDAIKGVLRTLGDAGATPANNTGKTVLARLVDIQDQLKLERWGKNIEPAWVHGAETTNPADGTALVTKAVSAAKTGFIYGFYITSAEARDFKINWTSGGVAKSIRIVHASKGTMFFTDKTPVNEGLGADASTNITITNVGAGAGIFQAGLLFAEV